MSYIELATFSLLPNADSNSMVEAETQIQTEVGPSHAGYVGRKLFRKADGSYLLLMHWADEQAANTWNKTLFASPAGPKMFSLVDPKTMAKEVISEVTA
ncbi:MAG TPA: hypothetical protein PK299_11020 [Anaerolineales bacterium]|nr:hypothetical protein [Anaerolineales bacterium]